MVWLVLLVVSQYAYNTVNRLRVKQGRWGWGRKRLRNLANGGHPLCVQKLTYQNVSWRLMTDREHPNFSQADPTNVLGASEGFNRQVCMH